MEVDMSKELVQGIEWLGHASFRILDGQVIYIDPWQLEGGVAADVILVTHGHRDHLSPEDIAKISTPDTVLVCCASCADELQGNVHAVQPGDTVEIGGMRVEVVPAYNTDKPNHPQEAGHVGYVLEIEGRRIYHAGDTDLIAEMDEIQCDVALLPMGGTYTMDAAQAAEAVRRIGPQVAIPMHWGRVVGSESDVERFRELAPESVEVVVLERTE
jgi:L-ascorbate metabolism protein UlaG (beta-lactamase superfamily)